MLTDTHPAYPFVPFENTAIDQSIPARFEQQAARYPDRLAVVSRDLQFTYAELNQVANHIARAILSHLGEGEEPVGLLFDHGAFLIAALLGVLKAGKFYMSLDLPDPQPRMASMLEDSRAKLLLTNTKHLSLAGQLVQGEQQILNCDDIDASLAAGNLDRAISPETCALMLYTSGTTGRPKGVVHSHRNILVEARNYTNYARLSPEDRLTLWHSCSYTNSIRNLYAALLNGAGLFIYDLVAEGFPALADWMLTHRITVIHTLPTTYRCFCQTLTPDAVFPLLRILRLGGESINRDDIKQYQRRFFPHCLLIHAIGPTETLDIRYYSITHDWNGSDAKIPIGYAVPDKEVLLLDEAGREVGAEEIGEIAVRSEYLALGYWRRPDLTEVAFTPVSGGGDERLYRTGDLGVMRPDGCLTHMGRKDFQIKIRGYRVEVAEIEGALLDMDSIDAAAVQAQADVEDGHRLVAYVVPAAGRVPTVSELRRTLAQTLPDYMMPSAFVFLEALPLSSTGKIDRRGLPAPDRVRPHLEEAFVAPRNPAEHILAKIWATLLNLERVGIHDNFFDLGGQSLLAVRLLVEIENEFGKRLPSSSLFKDATIEHLAGLISQRNELTPWPTVVALQPRGSKSPFFCVHELSGDVLCYMNLAQHLGQDQPLYALQARGLDGAQEPLADIKTMAAYYIEEMQTVQPRGPYALGGLSIGGIVAFEMAQQLCAKGEAVKLVALLDSTATNAEYGKGVWERYFLHNFLRNLPSWLMGSLQLNRSQWFDLIKLKMRRAEALALTFGSSLGTSERHSTNLVKEMGDLFHFSERHRKIARAQYQASREYKPKVYPGRLTLFRARMQPLFSSHDPEKGWRRLAVGGLDVRVVPGNHLGMLQEPHVQILAEELRACLTEAQTGIVVEGTRSKVVLTRKVT